MSERLDGYLAHRGFGTRSEVRVLIRDGQASVDGRICRDCGLHIDGQAVAVMGRSVELRPTGATLVMNKPLGYACSHDAREAPLIEELVPEEFRHLPLESAGRLDRDTSGIIILTTDGDLIHALTNPRKKLVKRYRVAYRGQLSSHALSRCDQGIMLDGDSRPTLPARLVLEDDEDGLCRATLFLAEGRYHQVRRMFAALGGTVERLHRDRIGGLGLPSDLEPGMVRALSADERGRLLDAKAESMPII